MYHNLKDVLPVTASVNAMDHLEIGGLDTTELAEEFGTPLFVFCEKTFRTRAAEIKNAFPDANIYYAAKAFLTLGFCSLIESEGLGLDVASGGELHTALTAGFPPGRMILHGNNKLDSDIERAIEAGIGRIAIDGLEEVERVADIARELSKTQPVVLRVTPGVEAHTHEYIETGQEDSKFGLSIEGGLAEEALVSAMKRDSLEVRGIHSHIGSNIFSYDPFGKTIEILFQFLADMKAATGSGLPEVNLGGGFGIPHVAGDYPARMEVLSRLITEVAGREAQRHGIDMPALSFEPGRYLVGNSMVTLYRVGTIKQIPGVRTYISVDGGMSDNIRPALYQAHYTALVANKAGTPPRRAFTLAGMHCESGDILAKDVGLPDTVERGDIIAVPATGAYNYSMASNYNRQPRPAVVAVVDGRATLMVRRETHDDLIRLDIRPQEGFSASNPG
ncbi:MAG: diaminopimelate decarboxylase [Actinomycetota bacterium]